MRILTMGSLYFNGEPLPPGYHIQEKGDLSLGNNIPERALQWVQAGELLIANRCVCTGVNWDDLNSLGYIFGNQVCIDGAPYTFRSLRLWGTPNEWDEILNQYATDDEIWHWKNTQFWGDGILSEVYCAVCAGTSPHVMAGFLHDHRSPNVGFRPVLTRLAGKLPDPACLVGQQIFTYGAKGTIVSGTLVRHDEYDLALEDDAVISDNCRWAVQIGQEIVVDRGSVVWMKKA